MRSVSLFLDTVFLQDDQGLCGFIRHLRHLGHLRHRKCNAMQSDVITYIPNDTNGKGMTQTLLGMTQTKPDRFLNGDRPV